MRIHVLTIIACVLVLGGCDRSKSRINQPAATVVPKIANLPARLTLKQRSTTPVPGSDGKLSVTVDDITGGQTMVSVLDEKSQAIMGPVSLAQGKSSTFTFGGTEYNIEMAQLDNALIGEDFVTLVINPLAAGILTEEQKIERLIAAVEQLEGATFVRNGADHTPAEAADHLRTKRANVGDRITTAEQFIEHLGSKSSISGDEYQIKMADGTVVPAGEFLRKKLAELEAAP